jgi:hypothetical protein
MSSELSDLTAITAPTSSDLSYVVQGGTSYQTTVGNLSKGVVVTSLDITGLTASQFLQINSGGTAIATGKAVPTGAVVGTTDTQTLTNKTLGATTLSGNLDAATFSINNAFIPSPVLYTPQIQDTSEDHQYIFAVNELSADRTVTLPLLTGDDDFVFEDHIQTLTNKTLTSPTINTPTLTLADTSPTADGSVGFDRTGEDLQVGDGTNSQVVHMGAWTSFSPGFTGFSADPSSPKAYYTVIGKTCIYSVNTTTGTSNATNFQVGIPLAARTLSGKSWLGYGSGTDNGSYKKNVLVTISSGGTNASLTTDGGAANWTASGDKAAIFTIIYEIA